MSATGHGDGLREAPTPDASDSIWSYVLITGDAIIGERVDDIIERLRAYDLTPTVGLVMPFDLRQLFAHKPGDLMFQIQNPGGEDVAFSFSMHAELYEMAPACILMLRRPTPDACRATLRCKGETRPEAADDATIRAMGENVIFNLVHCPDDSAEAHLDLSNLLGEATANRLVHLTSQANPDVCALAGVATLRRALPQFAGQGATSFPMIANRLRWRLLQWLVVRRELGAHPDLKDLAQRLADEASELARQTRSRDQLLVGQQATKRIEEALDAPLDSAGDEVITNGASALAQLFDLWGERDTDAIFRLGGRGVYVSPLERVIIQSHSYSFRPSDELRHIYG